MIVLRCASTNPGKLREFRMAASHFGFPSISIEPIEHIDTLPECFEDESTFEGNAVKKALHYSVHAHRPVFADDSGLVVDALNGAPGIYSARFAGPRSTDEANNRLLLEKLEGAPNRLARFVCAAALAHEGRLLGVFHGSVEGRIVATPSGSHGFGYDPLFFHDPSGCTFAELEPHRKMEISHRGHALKALLTFAASSL